MAQQPPKVLHNAAAMTADLRSGAYYTNGYNNGWFEATLVHTGDPVGALRFQGGNSSDESTHDDLELDPDQIFINGASLNDVPVTGLTAPVDATPGSIAVAAALAATIRVRVPVINAPAYVSLWWDHTSGGSSSSLLTATWYGSK